MARTPSLSSKNRSDVQADDRARHTAWLDWIEARRDITDTALAKLAGQSENTLTRFRNRDGAVLSGLTIRLISEATGLPGPETYLLPNATGFVEEAIAYRVTDKTADPFVGRMVATLLKDRPNAAPWVLKTRAIEGAGYLPGDIVIADQGVLPHAGDVVCAQVYDLRTGTAETVFRLYEPPYLISTSNESGLRKPLPVDNERVIVIGTVTETFRPRRR